MKRHNLPNLTEPSFVYKKFIALAVMTTVIAYVHHLLRITKDALVISHLGAEVISAIKLWFIVPMTLLFMLSYMRLTDYFSRSRLMHLMNWGLLSYFVFFVLVIYPNYERFQIIFHPQGWWASKESLRFVCLVISNWHLSLFYFFAEMWASVMLSISAWQVINHLSTQEEAKKFYPLFGFIPSLGSLAASLVASGIARSFNWITSLRITIVNLLIAAVIISVTLHYLVNLVGAERFNQGKISIKKKKISFRESLGILFTSKSIALIAFLLIGFNCSINLIEGAWKKSFELFLTHDAGRIQAFMGRIQVYISLLSCLFAFVGVRLLRRYSWRTVALITPVVFLICGGVFFGCVIWNRPFQCMGVTITAMQAAVYIGAIQNVLAHSTKRTLFDATKEMAYLPLDENLKTKGKAAAELIGMRLGKGCGAAIQQSLLMISGSNLLSLAPISGIMYLIIILCWIGAVYRLAQQRT